MKNNTINSRATKRSFQALCLLSIMLATKLAASELTQGRAIAIEQAADSFNLRWRDIAEAPYEVQTRTNLVRGSWGFLDIVMGTGGEAIYHVTPDTSPSRFFRVLFPQPAITASEPALTDGTSGGSAIYVTGSFFYPGDVIRVGGMLVSNSVYVTPSLLSADFPPGLQPGRYDIEIIDSRSGTVLATLPAALEVVDLANDPNRMLLEPPTWPPAGPTPSGKHVKTGHVSLLKAFDDEPPPPPLGKEFKGHVSLLKAFDDGTPPTPAGKHVKTGHVSLLKAFDDEPTPPPLGKEFKGHVSLLKAFDDAPPPPAAREHVKTGHVSLLKAFDDQDCDGDAILLPHSGEIHQQITDLQMPGRGLDFVWTRTYRSRTGEATSQGNRWTHSYDVRCDVKPGEVGAWIYDGTGRKDLFQRQADNTFTCPGIFREGSLTNGIFRLTFADTGFWEFNPQGTSPAAGKLARIEDRNGNAITLSYDGTGRLLTITDTLARVHTLAYTTDGRIASVTDSTGRAVTYAYYGSGGVSGGSAGDLRSVTSPPVIGTPNGNDFRDGKTVTYTYTSGQTDDRANHLLLTITDALGQTPLHCDYDMDPLSSTFQRCVSAQRGTLPPTCVTYLPQPVSPVNSFAVLRCLVNDGVGNVSERSFDLRNRCVTERSFTGRALAGQPVTDSVNRPTGKLRASDPDLFETIYSWNRDNLLIGGILPGGNVLSFVYEADLNPFTPARKRGDCRVVRERAVTAVDLDGDGTPDTRERVWQYTYDPRFGDDPSRKGWDGSVKGKRFGFGGETSPEAPLGNSLRKGWDGSVKGRIFDHRDDDCDGDRFVSSFTDPRGYETTGSYDPKGNLTEVSKKHVTRTTYCSRVHNTYGQLTAITNTPDANGFSRVDTFTYHTTGPQTGYLESIAIDEPGVHLTLAFDYDSRANVTRAVDPRGNDILISYNALNQPITVHKQTQGATFGERVKTTLFYDGNNNLVRIDRDNRKPDGAFDPLNPQWTTTFEYDPLKRLTQVAQEVAQTPVGGSVITNQFVYDANDQFTLHRLPEAVGGSEPNHVMAYTYDERGLLFSEARAPGTGLSTTDTFDYDANGNLVQASKLDAFTSTQTLFAYDGFDRCVTTIDPMGNIASRAFDANDNLVYERTDGETDDRPGDKGNRKLAETRYTYDGLDRCVGRIDSFFDIFTEAAIDDGEATTTWTYAPNGQLISVTDDNGSTSAYTYDRPGRLATVTDPRGNVTSYTYDPSGNVLLTTQADLSDVSAGQQVFTTTYTYDTLGRCITAIDNVGNSVTNTYDACDNLVSRTDPKGNETAYVYDGLGRVTDTANYSGSKERGITINTSHVEYRNYRLVSSSDANTNTTAYAYDACDRLTQVTHADTTVETLIWSPRSNLERHTDANGTTITNSYDLCERLIYRDIAVGAGVLATTTFESFTYDGLGRLVTAQNNDSTLLYTYDSLGNRVTSSQNGFVSTATFDAVLNRRTCTCPTGYRIHTTFDTLNRPSSVSLQASAEGEPVTLATFAYDGADRLAKITRANNINTRVFWDGVQGTPNATGDSGWQQVARINHARAGGGQIVDQRVSLYDRNQNKVTRAMTAPWSSGGTLVTNSYTYDAVNRLTQSHKNGAIIPTDFQYVYDANGNRLQVTNNGVEEVYTMDPTIPDPADFQMNQYTVTPFGSEYHDARGNRTGRHNTARSLSYRYDYADRLVQVDELDPIGTYVTLATYSYDPLGRRISKILFSSGLPQSTTTFVYDDGKDDDCDGLPDDDVLEVHKGAAVSSVSVLAGGTGGGAAAASYAATGRMFAPPVGFLNAAGEVYYTHCDDSGNMLALTDAAGNVVEHYDYGDFGAPLFFDRTGIPLLRSAVSNDVLFGGMRWDEETELYHREGSNPLFQGNSNAGNNPLAEPSSSAGGGGTYVDPLTGRPLSRSKGTVKFFNETKGFGRIGGGSTTRAQDHNSSRSNGCGGPTRGQDHNSVRSNKTASRVDPDGGSGGGPTRGQDHNSTRSNKTASRAAPDMGGGGGFGYTPVNLINPIAMDKGLRF
jgi:YD repeat-containing protein